MIDTISVDVSDNYVGATNQKPELMRGPEIVSWSHDGWLG